MEITAGEGNELVDSISKAMLNFNDNEDDEGGSNPMKKSVAFEEKKKRFKF